MMAALLKLFAALCSFQLLSAGTLERPTTVFRDYEMPSIVRYLTLQDIYNGERRPTSCRGYLLEMPMTEQSNSSDTVLMEASCFVSGSLTEPEQYYITDAQDKYVVSLVENDERTGRTKDFEISSVTLHLKYEVANEYNLAVVKLAEPINSYPLVKLSQFSLAEVENCSVVGTRRQFNFSIDSFVDMMLTDSKGSPRPMLMPAIVDLPDLKVTNDGNLTIKADVPLLPYNMLFYTDEFSSLVCSRDGELVMQGVVKDIHGRDYHTQQYSWHNDRVLYFTNIAAVRGWILNPALPSSIPLVLHHKVLAEYESASGNGTMVKSWYYAKQWRNKMLAEKIVTKEGMIDMSMLWGSSFEKNVYDCAITCNLKNEGKPCSYAKATGECFFSSHDVEPDDAWSDSPLITIYFKRDD